MSNIGKELIKIPIGTNIEIVNNNIIVKGPLGMLKKTLPSSIYLINYKNHLYTIPYNNFCFDEDLRINSTSDWGSVRNMIYNMIKGVNQGFNIKLQLVGIGYKSFLEKDKLKLKLGFSHIIEHQIPLNIKINLLKPTLISIFGIDIENVTELAAKIREYKKPEPYKGKGIKYINEIIIKKEGKKK